MMRQKNIYLFEKNLSLLSFKLIFLFFSIPTSACDGDYLGGFLEMAIKSDIVVLAEVKKYIYLPNQTAPVGMSVHLMEDLSSDKKILYTKTIIIWGDDGRLCRPPINQFPLASHWVFALNYVDSLAPFKESKPNYIAQSQTKLSNQGTYWLKYSPKDSIVRGNLFRNSEEQNAYWIQEWKFNQLKEGLKTPYKYIKALKSNELLPDSLFIKAEHLPKIVNLDQLKNLDLKLNKTIKLSAWIHTDGKISHLKFIGKHSFCDRRKLRFFLQKEAKWTAASHNGQKLLVKIYLNISQKGIKLYYLENENTPKS